MNDLIKGNEHKEHFKQDLVQFQYVQVLLNIEPLLGCISTVGFFHKQSAFGIDYY